MTEPGWDFTITGPARVLLLARHVACRKPAARYVEVDMWERGGGGHTEGHWDRSRDGGDWCDCVPAPELPHGGTLDAAVAQAHERIAEARDGGAPTLRLRAAKNIPCW